jgi:PLP dependent protein
VFFPSICDTVLDEIMRATTVIFALVMADSAKWRAISAELAASGTTLIAVSKTKPVADILELYHLGQRDFGENYVQELAEKHAELPSDIRWHFIGHLQTNKVKTIAPFVHLIHAVDSYKLLEEICKCAIKNNRTIDVLLQMHLGEETTKFGLNETELDHLVDEYIKNMPNLQSVRIRGLMGMASNTDDDTQIRIEFRQLKSVFNRLKTNCFREESYFDTCSIGMSSDYKIAVQEGGNMVRIGSLLFGERQKNQ